MREYLVLDMDQPYATYWADRLNDLYAQGYDLVQVLFGFGGDHRMIFKRRPQPAPVQQERP